MVQRQSAYVSHGDWFRDGPISSKLSGFFFNLGMWAKLPRSWLPWDSSCDLERSQQEDKAGDRKRWNRRNLGLQSLSWMHHSTTLECSSTALSFPKKRVVGAPLGVLIQSHTTGREHSCITQDHFQHLHQMNLYHGSAGPSPPHQLRGRDSHQWYSVGFIFPIVGTLHRMLHL